MRKEAQKEKWFVCEYQIFHYQISFVFLNASVCNYSTEEICHAQEESDQGS